jgi:hypothetical protein
VSCVDADVREGALVTSEMDPGEVSGTASGESRSGMLRLLVAPEMERKRKSWAPDSHSPNMRALSIERHERSGLPSAASFHGSLAHTGVKVGRRGAAGRGEWQVDHRCRLDSAAVRPRLWGNVVDEDERGVRIGLERQHRSAWTRRTSRYSLGNRLMSMGSDSSARLSRPLSIASTPSAEPGYDVS